MGPWTPVLVGNAFIVIVIATVAIAPHSWWAVELRRGYGIRPTGEDGAYTRWDHFRAAMVAFVAAILLVALGFGIAILGDRYPTNSTANNVAMAYMFGFILLGGLALLCSLIAAWNGLRWRPETRAAPDDQAI
jgi:hypothetical protein